MINFDTLAAHFIADGTVASGSNGNDQLFADITTHLSGLAITWPTGDTFHATHKRAVHVRDQLESYLTNNSFEPAAIYVKDPIPSELDPKTGGWKPKSRSVYFPIVKKDSGHTAQSPTFLLGIAMPTAQALAAAPAQSVEIALPNGIRLNFGTEVSIERVRDLIAALKESRY